MADRFIVRRAAAILLLAALIWIPPFAAAQEAGLPTSLEARLSSQTPKQGGIVLLEAQAAGVFAVKGFLRNEEIPFFPTSDPGRWIALLPFGLMDEPGGYHVAVNGYRPDGEVSRAVVKAELQNTPYHTECLTLPDNKRVLLSPEDEARADREEAELGEIFARRTPKAWSGAFLFPLKKRIAGSRFGSRRIMNGVPKDPHSGADYKAGMGQPVLAVNGGVVALAKELFFGGNTVVIDHGGGLFTMAMHLSKMDVAAGDSVEKGQVIGKVGATGRATGPHLHFGVRLLSKRVDPEDLFGLELE